jgi:outer membrane murein-binding lipoprotein Lpp
MKHSNRSNLFMVLLMALFALCMLAGCDSGEKVVDEATGNRAVKQYHQSKKDIEKIADKQAEKYGKIPDDDDKE